MPTIKIFIQTFHYRLKISFVLTFCILASCKNIKDGHIVSGKPLVINLDSSAKHYSMADFVDNVHLVCLESNENSILSASRGIQQVIHRNGKYFLFDGNYMAIKAFDSSGKYLYSVGKLGMSNGEFVRVDDVQYYPPDNSIMVLCNRPSKLAEFMLDGRLMRDSKLSYWATKVAFPSTTTRLFYVNHNKSEMSEDKNILIADSSNQINTRMFEMPKDIRAVIKFSGNLFFVDGEVFYNPPFSNTYYSIANDTARPVFVTNYGEKNIPTDIPQNFLVPNLSKFSYQNQTLTKTKDYLGFNFQSNQLTSAFFNLHSHNVITSDPNLDSLNILFSNYMFQNDDEYAMVLDLKGLSSFLKRNLKKIQQKFPLLYSQLNKNTSSDIGLLIFKLKSI